MSAKTFSYDYNGNVKSQTITVSGMSHPLIQTYNYDSLNRLQSAEEKSNNIPQWKQTYQFDRYGNRRFDTTNNNTTTLPENFDTNVFNPTFNTANNRMSDNQGYEYDSAGNVTKDASNKRFIYDAENKQTSFGTNGSNTNGGTYSYDGDGKRIKKIVGSETTVFVYNASGQLVAEYTATAPQNPTISYLTSDTLGTPRINTDAKGQVTARHDYMPFGEEIFNFGGRNSQAGIDAKYQQNDNIRQKFTSYERDNETNLDYAKARMFGSGLGRFTSPDPAMVSASIQNPQTWNRYVYVLNNPLKYSDPLGLWEIDQTASVEYEEYKDKNGKMQKRVKSVAVLLKKEKGDDVKTLAKQLNIKEKDASKILAKADKDGNIQLSKAGGKIGAVFGAIESRIKEHEQSKLDKPDKGDDQGWDCSRTTAFLAGFNMFGGNSEAQFSGANGLDESYIGQGITGPSMNVKEKDLQAGDMVRYGLSSNSGDAKHWATFLMFNSSGEPFVFSKSGISGPNEFVRAKDLEGSTYGSISTNSMNRSAGTGYYRNR